MYSCRHINVNFATVGGSEDRCSGKHGKWT